jgi:RNA polymerase sigma factor (TIGR02999 family)
MNEVTRVLSQIDQGDPQAAEELLPLVYRELRKLAAAKLSQEQPGQTLQATALVHEAYLRLVAAEEAIRWDSRGHFFAAAAEAMRRILVENGRRKATAKRGGGWKRQILDEQEVASLDRGEDLIEFNDALTALEEFDEVAAKLVKLRYFAGLSTEQAADVLAMSPRNAYYAWAYARSWLHRRLRDQEN